MATRKGHPISAATRAKISAALKGRHPKGHPVSAATRAKISAKLKGRKMSAAARAKLSARMKGRHLSAATRAKISAAEKARRRPRKPTTTSKHRTATTGVRRVKRTIVGRTAGKALISAHPRRSLKGLIHTHKRHRRTRIVIHRKARAHRVWHKTRRRRA